MPAVASKGGRKKGATGNRHILATERAKKKLVILRIVADSISRTGCQPSYRELARTLGYYSIGYIQKLIGELQKEGVVHIRGARALHFKWRDYL